jgi:hypothetical protein
LRVGRVENSQPHQTGWDPGDGANDAIDEDGVASITVPDGLRIGFAIVQQRPIGIERSILNDNGQVIDPVCVRQPEARVGAVIDDDQSRKSHIDLPGSVMVQMRMKPRGCGRLLDLESRMPRTSRLDDLMRSTIDLSRHQKSMPVHGRINAERIFDGHLHLVATA